MVSRKTLSSVSIDSVHSSRSPCSSVGDRDASDEEALSMDDSSQTRPLSVRIPKVSGVEGPYCLRRPNLQEILANESPAPWTLTAFMAYLSNNHCLETLEFTMDAGRYKKHYQRMMSKAPTPGQPTVQDADYIKELWTRLIDAYIRPNGTREVNLPSEVRDPILRLTPSSIPPAPEILDGAVAKTYELMEESVLVPFLNSMYPQLDASQENLTAVHAEERPRISRKGQHHSSRSSPPSHSLGSFDANSESHGENAPTLPNRKSAPSALTTALAKHRFSSKLSPSPTNSMPAVPVFAATSNTSSASDTIPVGPTLTDDSGSSGSPLNDSPMTPPVTPPLGDLSSSPRSHHRDSGTWKRLGRLSGWKPGRKRSQGFNQQE